MSRSKLFGWLLLAAVFAVNYAETSVETALRGEAGRASELGNRIAYAFAEIEPQGLFEHHEASGPIAVYGYSLSYFVLFPLLALALGVALALRREDGPFRVFARALAIDYAVSLPFFVFFPVPERWAYPDSGAMLLSDRVSSALIQAVRPISGLDNCFPSFHVSMTVVAVAVAYLAGVRFRSTLAAVGATVILSTFVLGIHWLPDIVAGLAAGILSVALALRLEPAGSVLSPAALLRPAAAPA